MAKSKKTILTEDAFNSNGNATVSQDVLNESTSDNVEESEVQSNNEVVDNDNINEEDTNEVQNEKTSETEVESEIKEDETTSNIESNIDPFEDSIQLEDDKSTELQSENYITSTTKEAIRASSEIIGFESCHDDLYYTGKLV